MTTQGKTLSNKQLKELTSLSLKKYRKESGLFLVEGEKLVEEVVNSNFKVDKT